MSALAIFVPRRFIRLMVSDAKNIARDPMLIAVSGLSIGPAAGFWFGRAAMDDAALGAFGIAQVSAYLVPVVLVLPALLIGWVTGFLMLEDRDDGALPALDVTPPGKAGFLAYRVTVTAGVAAAVTLFAAPLVIPGVGTGIRSAGCAVHCRRGGHRVPLTSGRRPEQGRGIGPHEAHQHCFAGSAGCIPAVPLALYCRDLAALLGGRVGATVACVQHRPARRGGIGDGRPPCHHRAPLSALAQEGRLTRLFADPTRSTDRVSMRRKLEPNGPAIPPKVGRVPEGRNIANLRDDGFNRVPHTFARQEEPTARRCDAFLLRDAL